MAGVIEKSITTVVTKAVGALAGMNRKRMPKLNAGNPYLIGLNQPMTEEKTIDSLIVDAEIPRELDGRYMRIGPNPVFAPDPNSYHW